MIKPKRKIIPEVTKIPKYIKKNGLTFFFIRILYTREVIKAYKKTDKEYEWGTIHSPAIVKIINTIGTKIVPTRIFLTFLYLFEPFLLWLLE